MKNWLFKKSTLINDHISKTRTNLESKLRFSESLSNFPQQCYFLRALPTAGAWNCVHASYLPMLTKGCSGSFILFISSVTCKNRKRPGFYTLTETSLLNNSRSKQNNKNSEHAFVDIGK